MEVDGCLAIRVGQCAIVNVVDLRSVCSEMDGGDDIVFVVILRIGQGCFIYFILH